jgi:hypothetical protein
MEELVKSFKGNDIWAVAELSTINEEVQVSIGILVAIQQLLSDYSDIFQEPTDLLHKENWIMIFTYYLM